MIDHGKNNTIDDRSWQGSCRIRPRFRMADVENKTLLLKYIPCGLFCCVCSISSTGSYDIFLRSRHYGTSNWFISRRLCSQECYESSCYSQVYFLEICFLFNIKFQSTLFQRFKMTAYEHWLKWWLGASSYYLNFCWLTYLSLICVTQPRWI